MVAEYLNNQPPLALDGRSPSLSSGSIRSETQRNFEARGLGICARAFAGYDSVSSLLASPGLALIRTSCPIRPPGLSTDFPPHPNMWLFSSLCTLYGEKISSRFDVSECGAPWRRTGCGYVSHGSGWTKAGTSRDPVCIRQSRSVPIEQRLSLKDSIVVDERGAQ